MMPLKLIVVLFYNIYIYAHIYLKFNFKQGKKIIFLSFFFSNYICTRILVYYKVIKREHVYINIYI